MRVSERAEQPTKPLRKASVGEEPTTRSIGEFRLDEGAGRRGKLCMRMRPYLDIPNRIHGANERGK